MGHPHNNTVSGDKNSCVDQVTVSPAPWKDKGWGRGGGGCMVLETTCWNQGSELSGATVISQMTMVADLTRCKE